MIGIEWKTCAIAVNVMAQVLLVWFDMKILLEDCQVAGWKQRELRLLLFLMYGIGSYHFFVQSIYSPAGSEEDRCWIVFQMIALPVLFAAYGVFFGEGKRFWHNLGMGLAVWVIFSGSFFFFRFFLGEDSYGVWGLDLQESMGQAASITILILLLTLMLWNIYAIFRRCRDLFCRYQRLVHDLPNHIWVIRHCILQEEYDHALCYLEQYADELAAETSGSPTGNYVLDEIITRKLSECEEMGVACSSRIQIPELLSVRDFEWTALFGNLLDNAREGAMRADGEKKLSLSVRFRQGCLLIVLENSAAAPKLRNGELCSVKEDGRHGIGMKQIARVVKRYHGEIRHTYEAGVFRVEILMYVTASGASAQ